MISTFSGISDRQCDRELVLTTSNLVQSLMGWITQPFEMYVALSPRLPKSAVIGAANAVAKWVKKEEARLFLKDAPVF